MSEAVTPETEIAETNDNGALAPIHNLSSNESNRVIEWIINDQAAAGSKPSTSDVMEILDEISETVGIALEGTNGYAYVKLDDAGILHYKRITNEEKIRQVADVENRDRDDVRFTKAVIDNPTLDSWIRLAIDTGRLEFVALEKIDVFENPDEFGGDL